MSRKQQISFFIPAYNCASTLEEAVRSVMETNFIPGDELILVNDGSADHTAEVMASLKQRYPQLTLLHHPRNKGGGATRNTAVEASTHELLFCLDADNVLAAGSIENLAACLAENQAAVASFQQLRYFSKNTGITDETWSLPAGEFSKQQALTDPFSPGAGGNYLFTKTSWITAGGYPDFAGALDTWGFGIRQQMTGSKVVVLENSYYHHRRLADSYFLRDAWSRRRSISIRATQLLVPFFDEIDDRDIDYILSKKYRYNWFDRLDKHPLKLAAGPKTNPVFTPGYTVNEPGTSFSAISLLRKLKQVWKR